MSEPKSNYYLGNQNLKKAGVPIQYDKEKVEEFLRCSEDIEYFIKKYIKIINIDKGLINFDPYPYQLRMAETVLANRFSIFKLPRQAGKTTIIAAICLHHVLFNKNYAVAVLAHKHSQAREILSRIQLAYEWLPKWLQQGIVKWNEGTLELENGSSIITAATTTGSLRGGSFNMIYLDEFAFVPSNMQEEFFTSVYPVISSGQTSKVVITSTPNGLNMFYKLWVDSEEGNNSYKRVEVFWSDVPGRDEKWKLETIRNTSERQFRQEFECEFLGSSNTLINASKLRQLAMRTPLRENGSTRIYAEPERGRQYIMTVDTSRGLGLDFSAYIIFDITAMPYTCAVVFRDAEISPLILPDILKGMAEHYNNCPILVETNDIGQQVADILYHDLEYENLVFATSNDRDGQYISSGFAGQKMHYGVRTTKQVKRIGTSNLKNIVENDKLIITDYNLIYELSRFVAHKQSFEADEGANDDLVMCCVLFAWMVNQAVFKDAGRIDIRQEILKQNQGIIEDQILSFGFMDGVDEDFVEDAREIQAKRNGWLLD